jgi:ABC-type multidrug transport system ATPase subunit
MAPEPVVHLRGAVALVDRFPALAGVDLDVAAGEVVLVRGANGAGKTTLLRTCAGLLPVTSGTARVLGVDLVATPSAVRRRVGLLGHATHLYGELTVRENVRFWARAAGASTADGNAALERLGVPDRLHEVAVRSLSTGQRRRVSFAAEASTSGATVLFASHELERAESVAGRVVTIAGGAVVVAGGGPS